MSWKDVLIENPWMPVRYLKYKYPDFHAYDLTNWLKKNNVKLVIDRDN